MNELLNTKVVSGVVRCGYLHLFTMGTNSANGEKNYSLRMYLSKEDNKETIDNIKKSIRNAIVNRWGDNPPKRLRISLRDGDKEEDLPQKAVLGEAPFKGHYFMDLKNKMKPGVVDQNVEQIPDVNSHLIKDGDYLKVSMDFFGYEKNSNIGVSTGLINVQHVKEGEPFSNRKIHKPSEDFSTIDTVDTIDTEQDFDSMFS